MTSPNATPSFGRRTRDAKLVPFKLYSYSGKGEEFEHSFTARASIDASTALQVNSKDPAVAARAIQGLLIRVLVDDDGISADARPRPAGEIEQSGNDDGQDDSSTEIEVYGAGMDDADSWVIGDEEKEFPSESLALAYARDNPSSLRRFRDLMDDPRHTVELSALRGLVKYLTEQSTDRPTQPSGGSSPRRTAKRRR